MTSNGKDSLEMVKEFNQKFNVPIASKPTTGSDEDKKLRLALIEEEFYELQAALISNDLVGVLDALTDIQYVLDGAYLTFGLHPYKQKALEEVHRSNLSKLDENGKPIYRETDRKVLKGPNYSPPNLDKVLKDV